MSVRVHARQIAYTEVERRALAGCDRAVVAELALNVADAVADLLVETAALEPALASALDSIYGSELDATVAV